ncbi:cyclin-K-like [Anopheles albimanus]|uniref:cyclin-K-like n=1 Tax=Anopheles albimanus TaxID=7167 RepID=UPI00163F493A|nr:cyclin-K-like [Anopheles albimanus]
MVTGVCLQSHTGRLRFLCCDLCERCSIKLFLFILCHAMPNWYYDKKDLRNTPSARDGIEYETERRYRKEGARFIMQAGTSMGLGHNTVATGVVYFHRFYMFHSFRTFPRYVTASCCLFLAGKVEETPKKCKDIIKTARALLSDDKFQSFGDDPKEEVMTLERILLQTIKFDLQVEHPYSFLVKYAKCLNGDSAKLQKMVQMAWNFVNDSLSTTVSIQWEPEIIAVALIYLACKLSKFTVVDWVGKQPEHLKWWDMFVQDVTMEILEEICHQVLDLYQPAQIDSAPPDSPPQLPPSKASPPMKRANISPLGNKNSPNIAPNTVTNHVVKPPPPPLMPVDIEANPIPKHITTDNTHYPYPPYPLHQAPPMPPQVHLPPQAHGPPQPHGPPPPYGPMVAAMPPQPAQPWPHYPHPHANKYYPPGPPPGRNTYYPPQ